MPSSVSSSLILLGVSSTLLFLCDGEKKLLLFCMPKLNRLLLLLGGDMVSAVVVKVEGGMDALLLLAVVKVDRSMVDALLL